VSRFAESGRELGADQAAAVVGVLSSGARVELLSAAAGTGKSFTVAALADAWTATGHRVIGLAPSQIAAQVLAEEGLPAHNIARWLSSAPVLQAGDLVVVDEAGMATTGDLARIHQHVADASGKLLLVGDPRQLAAVGPGGALADLGERGLRYELAEVRRFTHLWEATASLQLRDGDPAALEAYQRHGRIRDGGAREQTETAARRAWLADTLAGREALLLVGSNEAAARLSAELRAELVALGRVAEHGVELTAQGTVAGVGDLVQARRNAWHLIGHDGNTRAPINRQTYRVTATRDDGGLQVTDLAGVTLSLPRSYVAEHLTLAYVCTVHAAHGRTVDTAHAVIGPGADTSALYVALTRGRHHNTAYVITRAAPEDSPPGRPPPSNLVPAALCLPTSSTATTPTAPPSPSTSTPITSRGRWRGTSTASAPRSPTPPPAASTPCSTDSPTTGSSPRNSASTWPLTPPCPGSTGCCAAANSPATTRTRS
jgi:hypothetical protein